MVTNQNNETIDRNLPPELQVEWEKFKSSCEQELREIQERVLRVVEQQLLSGKGK